MNSTAKMTLLRRLYFVFQNWIIFRTVEICHVSIETECYNMASSNVSVSFTDLLRLIALLEGVEQTPENFHILPDNESMWNSILANAREHSGLLCLEITGSWSPAAKNAQPHFIRLAAKTNIPFLRVEIPQQKKSKVHDKVKTV